ncbi:MAG: glycoside hydrolase family 97 N-terminal domain-containing protein, partial [Prevotellaceae bacterium]|nr:glycoside hydrolase family 97 N-terminal domain-containing protein [Candidatus Colivivens equi]
MQKRLLSIGIATILSISSFAQLMQPLSSPNGKLQLKVSVDKDIKYSVYDNGQLLMKDNVAGMKFAGIKESKYSAVSTKGTIKEKITSPNYKFSSFESEYNKMICNFK